jgi:hypothetical protein
MRMMMRTMGISTFGETERLRVKQADNSKRVVTNNTNGFESAERKKKGDRS